MINKLNHVKELDGARGIAVVIVMLYHFVHLPLVTTSELDRLFVESLHIGWIGVDLFFVLSGFLITRILIYDKSLESFLSYLRKFYEKRALRIFPLYYLYLSIIFLVFTPLVVEKLDPTEQAKLLIANHDQAWFWLYVSNIKQVVNGSFYGALVGHLWSLSIEEQFYLFWPLVVYFCSLKSLRKVTVAIIIITPFIRVTLYFLGITPTSIYVFTLTRMDSLAVGALVAVLSIHQAFFNVKLVLRSFICLLMFSLLLIYTNGIRPDKAPLVYTVGYSLLAFTFGCLILMLQSNASFFGKKLFQSRFLIFMGKYSYALYMFHPAVRSVVSKLMGAPKVLWGSQFFWMLAFILICSGFSIFTALVSWHLFEKWFLKIKNRIHRSQDEQAFITVNRIST